MYPARGRFVTGFLIGLLLFIFINLLAAHLASDCGLATLSPGSPCADAIARLGWPRQFYETGGFMVQHNFNALYLFLDILIGLALAVVAGWLFSHREKTLPK